VQNSEGPSHYNGAFQQGLAYGTGGGEVFDDDREDGAARR